MRAFTLLACAVALTLAEEQASAENVDETTKEDLNPEASSRRKQRCHFMRAVNCL